MSLLYEYILIEVFLPNKYNCIFRITCHWLYCEEYLTKKKHIVFINCTSITLIDVYWDRTIPLNDDSIVSNAILLKWNTGNIRAFLRFAFFRLTEIKCKLLRWTMGKGPLHEKHDGWLDTKTVVEKLYRSFKERIVAIPNSFLVTGLQRISAGS